jgi:P-type Cu2+ transporter
LEIGSSHPLAEGFRRAWGNSSNHIATEVRHLAGCGLEGIIDGTHVRIGAPRWVTTFAAPLSVEMQRALGKLDSTLTPVLIAVNDVVIACAGLGDAIRADALDSLKRLRSMGWRTIMLSGDSNGVAMTVGSALRFNPGDVFAERSPEQKLAFVELRKARGERVVMVGDGVNDAAAIAAATVGIGVHGGAEASLANADIYLTRPGLATLVELLEGTRRTRRVIVRNIAFSVLYNIVGAGLAIVGVLTPLIAAVLMPTSSITVVLSSWVSRTFPRTGAHRT